MPDQMQCCREGQGPGQDPLEGIDHDPEQVLVRHGYRLDNYAATTLTTTTPNRPVTRSSTLGPDRGGGRTRHVRAR